MQPDRVDVDQNNITERLVTGEDTTLDGSAVGNSFIRVNSLRRFLPEVLLQQLLNLGNTSRTTNEHDLYVVISKCKS